VFKRIFGLILLVGLTAVGLLHPLIQTPTSQDVQTDPVTITRYVGNNTVAADGTMTSSEVITAQFPFGRHGIFRFFDVTDTANPDIRHIPTITAVTLDGAPVQYTSATSKSQQTYSIKIGDPSTYVSSGQHTYTISYSVPGVISPVTAGQGKTFESTDGADAAGAQSAFYWQTIAKAWQLPIAKAIVTVNLPAPAQQIQCSAGTGTAAAVEVGACGIQGAGTNRVTLTANNIPPFSGMTTRISMQPPPPARDTLPWAAKWDPILGRSLPLVIFVGLLSIVGLVVGFGWARSSREQTPGLPVMYAPPKGLGPVQTVYIAREAMGENSLSATLFYLADKGLAKLESRTDESWLITGIGTPEQWAQMDPTSQAVGQSLGITSPGFWFLADKTKSSGEVLLKTKDLVPSTTKRWASDADLIKGSAREGLGRVLWIVALVLAGVGFFGIFGATMWGLPFASFVIGGLGLMATGVGTRRTETGRRLWSEAGGFERLLSTSSAEDRFDFAANKDLFISFIPFAVAFGVADKWAEKYRIYTHSDPPIPMWYPMAYGSTISPWSGAGGGFGNFDQAISASIGTYEASQASSGSGGFGGGGGGFGGGGGGGGGGSW